LYGVAMAIVGVVKTYAGKIVLQPCNAQRVTPGR